jgi:hypothetical protein
MKTLAMCLALALASAGCLATYTPTEPTGGAADMAHAVGTGGNGGTGGSGGGGSGGGGGGGNSTSTDMTTLAASTDMAGAVPGTKAFGDLCTVSSDCQSLLCEQFVMGTVHRCSKSCTIATQTADCPAPSAGTCTNNGYCKFNQ